MDPIDRELASLLSVEPSPEFRTRVRMRIASEPTPRAGLQLWRAVAAGVGVVGVVAALVAGRSQLTGTMPQNVAYPVSSSGASGSVASPPRAVAAAAVMSSQETHRRQRQRPAVEVLVSRSEVRGLRQLAAIVGEGRTQFVFSNERVPDAVEPVQDIVIAPIAIAPIEIATNESLDVTKEGDGQ